MPEKPDWIKNPPPGHFVGESVCLSKEVGPEDVALYAEIVGKRKAIETVCKHTFSIGRVETTTSFIKDEDSERVDTFSPQESQCSQGMREAYTLIQVSRVHCPSGTMVWNEGTKKFVPEAVSTLPPLIPLNPRMATPPVQNQTDFRVDDHVLEYMGDLVVSAGVNPKEIRLFGEEVETDYVMHLSYRDQQDKWVKFCSGKAPVAPGYIKKVFGALVTNCPHVLDQTLPPEKTQLPPPKKQEVRVVAPENPKGRVDTVEKGKKYYVYLYEAGKNVPVPKGTKWVLQWEGGKSKEYSLQPSTDQSGLTISIPAKAKGETITLQITRPDKSELSVSLPLAGSK